MVGSNIKPISFTAFLFATAVPTSAVIAQTPGLTSPTGAILAGAADEVASSSSASQAASVPPKTNQPQPVNATSAAIASDENITITARRTRERLQDVPVSVTAINSAQLETAKVKNLTDIQQLSPSLNITPLNGVGTAATVSIRGQVQTTAGIGVDPSTGVYIDEVYVARPASLNASLYDVTDVQVLKGPQGTLFGRNSVGGALLVETRRPGPEFGGYVYGSIQAPWGYTLEGALNAPLAKGIGLRVSGQRLYVQGYSRVVGASYRLDDTNSWSGRATLDASLGSFRNTLIGDIYTSRVNGPATYPLPFNPAIVTGANAAQLAYLAEFPAAQNRDFRLAAQTQRTFGRTDTAGVANISTLDLADNVVLKNILGWRRQHSDDLVDHDALAAPILYTEVDSNTHQFSEELQLQAKLFNKSVDSILGAYYFREAGHDYSNSYVFRAPTSVARGQNRFDAVNKAASVFAHASWLVPIGVPAHLFGGIRVTHDTRQMFFESRNVLANGSFRCTVANGGPNCRAEAQKTFPATTWDVGVDIKPVHGVMTYASISRGYRTGGFNGRATSLTQETPFLPEFVTSYEVGAKTQWTSGDMGGTFNLAAYYAAYTNIQRTTVINGPSGPQSSTGNAASGRVEGLEAEATIRFGRDVRLLGFYSLIDAKYKKYIDTGVDRSANQFPFVPKNQAGATIDWVMARLARGDEFGFNANWSYRDGYFIEIINTPTTRVNSYNLFNASMRWDNIRGSGISADLYVRNLFDKHYDRGGFSVYTSVGVANVVRGDPRTVGVSLRLPFGGER